MTITVELPSDLERLLRDRARQSERGVEEVIVATLREQFPATNDPVPAAEEDEAAPWRGIFVLDYPRTELFQQEVNVRTADLTPWQPEVVIGARPVQADDE